MPDFAALQHRSKPFDHWVGDGFVDRDTVAAINAAWPQDGTDGWRHEDGVGGKKSSLLFPKRLPAPAQALAAELFGEEARARLSAAVGMQLLPDPWFLEGPETPRLGGGLHEIHPRGLLKVHVDFERHPSGLRRVANLLIYLNEDWKEEWGGALELHDGRDRPRAVIPPIGGRAVLFLTTPQSWHGHPHPLACPAGKTRRSLALYYYAAGASGDRAKTIYRTK